MAQDEGDDDERGEDGQNDDDVGLDADGGEGDEAEHEGGEGLLGLDHGGDGDLLLVFGGSGLDEDGTGDAPGGVDIAQDVVDRGDDDGGIDPMRRVRGTKMRMRASVKPQRSRMRPIMTLQMRATPTVPVRKTLTMMGRPCRPWR